MTARDIQQRLIADRYARSLVMPNYTPYDWFECDVFELTKSGYFVEYEIKLSRSDFDADSKKTRQKWVDGDFNTLNKHVAIAQKLGPSRFYFVCPQQLLKPSEVPVWAGLIYAHFHALYTPPWRVSLRVVKGAPIIHRRHYDERVQSDIWRSSYYRFMKLFFRS